MDLVGLAVLGGVTALLVVDAQLQLRALRPVRKTRPRHEPDLWRCPFCHEALAAEAARTRCTSCGTRHHAGCWTEHGGCSVHACGSLEGRTLGSVAPRSRPTDAPLDLPAPLAVPSSDAPAPSSDGPPVPALLPLLPEPVRAG